MNVTKSPSSSPCRSKLVTRPAESYNANKKQTQTETIRHTSFQHRDHLQTFNCVAVVTIAWQHYTHTAQGHLSNAGNHERLWLFAISIQHNKFFSKIAKDTATQARCAGGYEANIATVTKFVYFLLQCARTLRHDHDLVTKFRAIKRWSVYYYYYYYYLCNFYFFVVAFYLLLLLLLLLLLSFAIETTMCSQKNNNKANKQSK